MTKVLVSFDDGLLRRIDRKAKDRGLSRSAFLAEAAERNLGGSARGPGSDPHVRAAIGALKALAAGGQVEAEDATDFVRRDRDSR